MQMHPAGIGHVSLKSGLIVGNDGDGGKLITQRARFADMCTNKTSVFPATDKTGNTVVELKQ